MWLKYKNVAWLKCHVAKIYKYERAGFGCPGLRRAKRALAFVETRQAPAFGIVCGRAREKSESKNGQNNCKLGVQIPKA
jgi:hypothetical protein|tara:strand:- start:141 stop:377 length:237 start_codon:yes stop_codon:yes gene_type:complete